MTKQPTRKEFKNAVIQALQGLGGKTTDRSALYTNTFTLLAYDPDLMGVEEKSGRSRAGKAFNAVCFALRKEGKLICKPRGTYSLPSASTVTQPQLKPQVVTQTPQVETQSQLKPQVEQPKQINVEKEVDVVDTNTPPVVTQPQKAIVIDRTIGVSLNLPQIEEWDHYLISLATKNSACFGTKYSHRSSVCKGCPMSVHCRAQRGKFLADLARDLEAAVVNGSITQYFNDDVEDDTIKPVAQVDVDVEPEKASTTNKSNHMVLTIEVSGVICEQCNTDIAKGLEAICIPGKGTFHPLCAP